MLVFAKEIIMKIKNYLFIVWALAAMNVQAGTLQLDLKATIAMAQRQSPSVQSARNTFLSAYWAYRYHQANYLPSLSLSSSPYINKEVNKITQSDGTALFLKHTFRILLERQRKHRNLYIPARQECSYLARKHVSQTILSIL